MESVALSRIDWSNGPRSSYRSYALALQRYSCVVAVSRPWHVVRGHAARREVPV